VGAALVEAGRAAGVRPGHPEVLALQEQAARVMLCGQRNRRHAARVLAAVREQIRQGQLGIARHLLAAVASGEGCGDDERGDDPRGMQSRAMDVMAELNDRQLAADVALQRAEQAMARGDHEAALREAGAAMSADPSDARARELAGRIEPLVCDTARTQLVAGRVDACARMIEPLTRANDALTPAGRDLVRAVEWCREAYEAAERGKFGRAIELLARLRTTHAEAAWIADVVGQLRKASEAMEQVRGGPLGLMGDTGWTSDAETTSPPMEDASIAMSGVLVGGLRGGAVEDAARRDAIDANVESAVKGGTELPSRFVLQVDGVGSFVVVCGDVVTIGPVAGVGAGGAARGPDVGLVAEASAATVTISRDEGDYFMRSTAPVKINEVETNQKLLASGDRIGLSTRCRVGFAIPNAAATTAVIDLVGARYPRGDVRRVILLDRDLVIGPGTISHVRLDTLEAPVVLHLRGRALHAETSERVESPGGVIGPGQALPMDTPLRCGELGFVMTRV
jgi:hypothetical protein